jgi:hypothetical protein
VPAPRRSTPCPHRGSDDLGSLMSKMIERSGSGGVNCATRKSR